MKPLPPWFQVALEKLLKQEYLRGLRDGKNKSKKL